MPPRSALPTGIRPPRDGSSNPERCLKAPAALADLKKRLTHRLYLQHLHVDPSQNV